MGEMKKFNFFPIHVIITFLFMFGFGFLPTFSTVTPVGMKLIGIFLGLLYAWTTTSLIWPSLLGVVAVAALGIMPMSEFAKISFGNSTVIFILFLFFLLGFAEEAGLVRYLGNWFLSRKIAHGHPWMLTFMILFAAFVAGALVNEVAAILIFWGIYYTIAKEFGFKPFDKYSTLMICGIAFCAGTAAASALPFKLGPLIWLASYEQVSGTTIPYNQYMLFAIPLCILCVIAYTLIIRFVFRPDISALKKLDASFVKPEDLILNKTQKIAFIFILTFMVLILAPSFFPKSWPIIQLIAQIGNVGVILIILIAMFLVKVDDKPLMNFPVFARNISWDIYALFVIVLPIANLLTSDMTGVKPMLIELLTPLLAGKSPFVFALIVLASGTILTNVSNNAVLGIIYINLMYPIAQIMNLNVFPIIAVMVFTIQLAYLTPAASAPAAIVFSNIQWIKAKDVMKYQLIILPILFVILFIVGIPYANLIFN